LMPLSRPPFRGLFLGLRIGDPAPPAGRVDEVKRNAGAGHNADWVEWEVSDGRISSIDYGRKVIWTPAPGK